VASSIAKSVGCGDGGLVEVVGRNEPMGKTMVFWAILCAFVGTNGPVSMMYVGSFKSLADCEKYASQFTVTAKSGTTTPSFSIVCVQSNQTGTTPPHN
jgi:hypothetical protein